MKSNIGQRVIFFGKGYFFDEWKGRIIGYDSIEPSICIEFDKGHPELHDGNLPLNFKGKSHHCWWVYSNTIKIITLRNLVELVEEK